MQIIPLYRYTRPKGGVTVSPIKPECEYTELFRLVANDGMALTNGETTTYCVDTGTMEGWAEVEAPTEEIPE
jgi:hypothetical protein